MEKEGSVSTGDQSHKTSFLEEEKYIYIFFYSLTAAANSVSHLSLKRILTSAMLCCTKHC